MEVAYATALPGLYVLLTHPELSCCQIWDQKEILPQQALKQGAALPYSAKEVISGGSVTKLHTTPALWHSCHTHSPTLQLFFTLVRTHEGED